MIPGSCPLPLGCVRLFLNIPHCFDMHFLPVESLLQPFPFLWCTSSALTGRGENMFSSGYEHLAFRLLHYHRTQNEILQLVEDESNGTRITQFYCWIIKALKINYLVSFFFFNLKVINLIQYWKQIFQIHIYIFRYIYMCVCVSI